MEKKPILLAVAFSALLSLPTASVQAVEAVSPLLEEVVVTARKREETAQSVPIPITALSAEQLDARNIIEVRDLEKLTPNTSIQYSAVNGTVSEVFMRGIGQVNWSSTQDPKIGIYVDGVYLSRPQGGLFDFMDVERVEILRGPQGTLFGRNTTAGLIQVINKKPSFENEFEIKAGFGSDAHRTLGFVGNLPLSDRLAVRASAYDKQTDGFIDNAITGQDRGNENSLSYRASLLLNLESYSAQLSYDHFEADERAPLGSCRFTGPDNPLEAQGLGQVAALWGIYGQLQANCEQTTRRASLDTTNDESTKSDVNAYTLMQTYGFGSLEVSAITAYREIDNFNGSWGWVMGNGPGANFLEILNNYGDHEVFSQELRLAGSTERLDWVVGAYIFKEDSLESLDVPLFRGVTAPSFAAWPLFHFPTGAANPDGSPQTFGDIAVATQIFGSRSQAYDVTNKNKAVFAEATYAVTDKLDLTLGVRYTDDKRTFTRIQTLFGGEFDPGYLCPGMPTTEVAPSVFVAASDRCTQQVKYDKTTPRAILGYQLSDAVMLYGSYSLGYSSGGFNQDTRMRPYLPEESDNFELGVKSVLFDGSVRLNATAFHNTYKNQQITVGRIVGGQPTADLINAQKATIKGVEFEFLGQLADSLALSVSAGFIDGKYNEFTVEDNVFDPITLEEFIQVRDLSSTGFGDDDGEELSLDIGLLHNFKLQGGGDITSSIGFSYTDERFYTLANTPSSRVGSYWMMDTRVTWNLANGKTSISLWGTNLTDEDYIDTMLSQSGDVEIGGSNPSLGMTADYWGEPRRYGLEVRHTL